MAPELHVAEVVRQVPYLAHTQLVFARLLPENVHGLFLGLQLVSIGIEA